MIPEAWGYCDDCERWFYCEGGFSDQAPLPKCPVCRADASRIEISRPERVEREGEPERR